VVRAFDAKLIYWVLRGTTIGKNSITVVSKFLTVAEKS